MGLSDIPILSMLRTRLQWAQERQRVLAENVANSDTPEFPAARPGAAEIRAIRRGWRPRSVAKVALARTESEPHRRRRLSGGIAVPQLAGQAATRSARPATRSISRKR